MSATPVVTPPKHSHAVWWVLGILGSAVFGITFLSMNIASFIVHRTQVVASGKGVEISTPAGKIELHKAAVQTEGLPIYPGAMPKGSRVPELNFPLRTETKWPWLRRNTTHPIRWTR